MSQLEMDVEMPVGISYSGGASSRWLIDAIIRGVIRRPANVAAFFADTGEEHEWTYEDVARTEERCKEHGIPFFRTATHRGETLSEAVRSATRGERTRLDNPPFWTENPGGGRGQLAQRCTQIWKTRAIRRAESEWLKSLGLPKKITAWIGFGLDELHRAVKAVSRNEVQWQRMEFPAIRMRRTRDQQRAELVRWTDSAPLFSACRICPFLTPARWQQQTPTDRAVAIDLDERIRDGLRHVAVEEPAFLSDRLIPLKRLVRSGDRSDNGPSSAGCDGGMCFQ